MHTFEYIYILGEGGVCMDFQIGFHEGYSQGALKERLRALNMLENLLLSTKYKAKLPDDVEAYCIDAKMLDNEIKRLELEIQN